MPADEFIFTNKTLVRILLSRQNYISDPTDQRSESRKAVRVGIIDKKIIMEIEIFNEGFTNEINPMSPMELECIYGGGGNPNILTQCDKGYKAGGQSISCKCGFKVFLPTL